MVILVGVMFRLSCMSPILTAGDTVRLTGTMGMGSYKISNSCKQSVFFFKRH